MVKNLGLEVRTQKVVYLDNKPLLTDFFNEVYELHNYLVCYNSNKLVIINSEGEIVI